MQTILKKIDQANRNPAALTAFRIGDTVKVSVRIKEGDKERIQHYTGTVIARKGGGATETFTVRYVSFGEGTERVFCLHSPTIVAIEVKSSAKVRRAKLYYLRGRSGKQARLKTRRTAATENQPPPETQNIAQD